MIARFLNYIRLKISLFVTILLHVECTKDPLVYNDFGV